MNKEIEIRFSISDADTEKIAAYLKRAQINATSSHQVDDYYCDGLLVDSGKTKNRGYILRIRTEEKKSQLAYKEFSGASSWIEIESGISDPSAVAQILERIGQKPFLRIDKKRQSARIGEIEMNIDAISGLGNFVELEIMHENERLGKNKLNDFLEKELCIRSAHVIERGYVQLMEEAKKEPRTVSERG